jgi:diacylglycerol kinase family enzyme
MSTEPGTPPSSAARAAALGALVLALAALALAVVGLQGDVWRAVVAPVLLAAVIAAGWIAATRTGAKRIAGAATAAVAAAAVLVVVLTADKRGLGLVLVAALVVVSVLLARRALDVTADRTPSAVPGERVGAATKGAVIMNLRSGGGKAERFHLEDEARRRGLEPIVLQPGDDLLELARGAIARGADVIGVAGGDGTQALVASVAKDHDVAIVCIPAGTRNHFALDLGLDRDDVVGALDAFSEGIERRIDLATVNDRLFVNNVSLGVYARIVQSPEYRDAKRQTTTRMLPELLGPEAEPFDLRFATPEGERLDGAQIVLVSNNPYTFSLLGGFGTRADITGGVLGVSAARVAGAGEAASAAAAMTAGRPERFRGWHEWTAPELVVDSSGPVEAGVDGEALTFDPPLRFRSLPAAVRVRIPVHAPGLSPAARRAPSVWWSIGALWRVAAGRPARSAART